MLETGISVNHILLKMLIVQLQKVLFLFLILLFLIFNYHEVNAQGGGLLSQVAGDVEGLLGSLK